VAAAGVLTQGITPLPAADRRRAIGGLLASRAK
jgi:hypothetical protein